MMELAEILNEIQESGLRAVIRGGVLFVGPLEKITDNLREAVKSNMPDLIAHFLADNDEGASWRVARMLAQLLPLSWPCTIPILCAAPDAQPNKEDCVSCGEIKNTGEGDSYVCGACARAKDLALALWLQRSAATGNVA